jgi:mono/diheme cytochrome c family protein
VDNLRTCGGLTVSTSLRRLLRVALVGFAVLTLAGAGGIVYAISTASRRWDAPTPDVFAGTSPAARARGEKIFRSVCISCHGDPAGRAAGKRMDEVPAFLGTFTAPNITGHPSAGIGRWTDGELARLVRYGLLRDGRRALIMPTFEGLSDDDLAGVLAFLRSSDPIVAPQPTVQPRSEPSLLAKLILVYVTGVAPPPGEGVRHAPAVGPTVEYGGYLAKAVLQCFDCHTEGFGSDKVHSPRAYAGGFELTDAAGRKILSANITPDEATGIGRWTAAQFVRAVRDGVRPDGGIVRPPMPRMRALDEVDLVAIYAYLRTVPPVSHAVPRPATPTGAPAAAAAQAFESHGCAGCHAPGAAYHDRLQASRGRTVEEVVARILTPEKFNPATEMPSYAGDLDEATARLLAEYVRSGSAP